MSMDRRVYLKRGNTEDLAKLIGEAVLEVYQNVKNGSTKGGDILIQNEYGERINLFVCPPGMKAQAYFEQ